MKFEILDQYIEQKRKTEEVFNEMIKREQEALEAYHAKKAEYETTIKRAAIERKDLTKELDKLDDEIAKAKAAYERRRKEREIYSQTRPLEQIKSEDVVNSFNNELIPAFREMRFNPVLKRLLKAKYEYAKAVEDYYSALSEFEDIRREARRELSDHYYYKLQDVELKTQQEVERYFITRYDIYDLDNKTFPRSLQYIKPEELK
jgi:predicted RNase H-like nuclease (RuvC/YqgF family)